MKMKLKEVVVFLGLLLGPCLAADTFSVETLMKKLAPAEALDLRAALALIEPMDTAPDDPATLHSATVENEPLLHYLFSLLPRLEHHGPSRAALGRLLQRLVAHGANANALHPNPNDPSLLYKAIFTREMGLAKFLVEAGAKGQSRDPDSALAKLVNIPCDVVPFSKLLLHADTALKNPTYSERFSGVEGKRKFVGSANREPGSKPIPRSDELFEMSSIYQDLVGNIGDLPPKGLDMATLADALGQSVASVLSAMLRSKGATSRLTKDIARQAPDGRNPLHNLAAAGSPAAINELASFVRRKVAVRMQEEKGDPANEAAERKQEQAARLKTAVASALGSRDSRGLTPLKIAAIRWGLSARDGQILSGGSVVTELQDLAAIVGYPDDSAATSSISSEDFKLQSTPVSLPANGGWNPELWAPLVANYSYVTSGGDITETSLDSTTGACGVLDLTIDGDLGADFSETFLREFVFNGRPVILRGAVPAAMRLAFSKDDFLMK